MYFFKQECQLFIDELLKKDERTLWMLLRAANFLQVEGLFEMVRDTLAQNTGKSVRDVEQELFKSFKQCVKVIFLAATMFTACCPVTCSLPSFFLC